MRFGSMLHKRGNGLERVQGEKVPVAASARNNSEERFFTEKGEMRSSPAITTERDEGPTESPMAGESRGVGVCGRYAISLDKGLMRRSDLGPAARERKHSKPADEAAGAKGALEGRRGARGSGRQCQEREVGSRRQREKGLGLEGEVGKKAKEGRGGERRRWEWRKAGEKRREWMRRESTRKRKKAAGGRKTRMRSNSGGGSRLQIRGSRVCCSGGRLEEEAILGFPLWLMIFPLFFVVVVFCSVLLVIMSYV